MCMRHLFWIAVGVCAALVAFRLVARIGSPQLYSFNHGSPHYYSNLAVACYTTMARHHPTSNDSTTLWNGEVLSWTLMLSGRDSSLPKIILDLNAREIMVTTNELRICSPEHERFDIRWLRVEESAEHWALELASEGPLISKYELTLP